MTNNEFFFFTNEMVSFIQIQKDYQNFQISIFKR